MYQMTDAALQPYVNGLVTMVNSVYNGYRLEDVWLNK